jgi:hypothetical protein
MDRKMVMAMLALVLLLLLLLVLLLLVLLLVLLLLVLLLPNPSMPKSPGGLAEVGQCVVRRRARGSATHSHHSLECILILPNQLLTWGASRPRHSSICRWWFSSARHSSPYRARCAGSRQGSRRMR